MVWALILLFSTPTFAEDETGEILCERTPNVFIVGEALPSAKSENPCAGSAKIQGIGYECGDTMNTYTSTQKFLKENIRKAKLKCTEFCESISTQCAGHLSEQTSCGFTVPTNRALDAGRNVVHCPKHCKGQAFNYCSLYHANYFSVDKEQFINKPANCYCQKKLQAKN